MIHPMRMAQVIGELKSTATSMRAAASVSRWRGCDYKSVPARARAPGGLQRHEERHEQADQPEGEEQQFQARARHRLSLGHLVVVLGVLRREADDQLEADVVLPVGAAFAADDVVLADDRLLAPLARDD